MVRWVLLRLYRRGGDSFPSNHDRNFERGFLLELLQGTDELLSVWRALSVVFLYPLLVKLYSLRTGRGAATDVWLILNRGGFEGSELCHDDDVIQVYQLVVSAVPIVLLYASLTPRRARRPPGTERRALYAARGERGNSAKRCILVSAVGEARRFLLLSLLLLRPASFSPSAILCVCAHSGAMSMYLACSSGKAGKSAEIVGREEHLG